MLPSVFLLGLVLGGLGAILVPILRLPYLAAVSAYAAITFIGALHRQPRIWFLTWLGIVGTHMVYGFHFLRGLTARRMPEAAGRFDHPSESLQVKS